VVHRNAPLSETGRLRLARCVVDDGWSRRRAADRFQVSVTTVCRWVDRYLELGEAGMVDRSSRPHYSPNRTPTRIERRIIGVRVTRRWGPARIAYLLRLNVSTVHNVLRRYRIARLRWLDRATGRVVRRMESAACGDLVHVDVKKLGKIPAGGGWRKLGRSAGKRNSQADKTGATNKSHQPVRGYHFIHTAIDAHSRLAYSEMLPDGTQGHRRRVLATSQRLVRRTGHRCSEGVDRQRVLLSLACLPGRAGRRRRAPQDSAVSAADQRESGALPPHPGRRMGLRPALHQRRPTLPGVPPLAAHLQSL
jgi:hypothetical protein